MKESLKSRSDDHINMDSIEFDLLDRSIRISGRPNRASLGSKAQPKKRLLKSARVGAGVETADTMMASTPLMLPAANPFPASQPALSTAALSWSWSGGVEGCGGCDLWVGRHSAHIACPPSRNNRDRKCHVSIFNPGAHQSKPIYTTRD